MSHIGEITSGSEVCVLDLASLPFAHVSSGLKIAQEPFIVCTHAQTKEDILADKTISEDELNKCRELGEAMAAGLAMGVF